MPLIFPPAPVFLAANKPPAPESYMPKGYIPGTSFVFATTMSGDRVAIFDARKSLRSPIASVPEQDGYMVGVNQVAAAGHFAVLVLNAGVYIFDFRTPKARLVDLGSVRMLPRQFGDDWVGTVHPNDVQQKDQIFVLSPRGFAIAECPSGLVSINSLHDRPLYQPRNVNGERFFIGTLAPTIDSGRFMFGPTDPCPYSAREIKALGQFRLGPALDNSGLFVLRQRIPRTELCSVWLCQVSGRGPRRVLRVLQKTQWPYDDDFDQIYASGRLALLLLQDGSIARTALLSNQATNRTIFLSFDIHPVSPSTGPHGVFGTVMRSEFFGLQRQHPARTPRSLMYSLENGHFHSAKLPWPWEAVVMPGPNKWAVEGTREDGKPVFERLRSFPKIGRAAGGNGRMWVFQPSKGAGRDVVCCNWNRVEG